MWNFVVVLMCCDVFCAVVMWCCMTSLCCTVVVVPYYVLIVLLFCFSFWLLLCILLFTNATTAVTFQTKKHHVSFKVLVINNHLPLSMAVQHSSFRMKHQPHLERLGMSGVKLQLLSTLILLRYQNDLGHLPHLEAGSLVE